MKFISEIISEIGNDERIALLFKQDFNMPLVQDNYMPFNDKWYNHPPMLVPVFIDYSFPILKGLTVHPFVKRESSIVTYDLETDYMLEKARAFDQFLSLIVLEVNMIEEGLSGDFRWTPGNQNFYKKVDGEWIKHTWHHHQDGKTIFPLDSRIHSTSEPGSSGFPHSGGDALIEEELKEIFESPIFN